jgi:hypothetical protein
MEAMRKRRVLPAVETMFWHYAKGKPVERHEIATPGDFSKMSDAELRAALEVALLSGRPRHRPGREPRGDA